MATNCRKKKDHTPKLFVADLRRRDIGPCTVLIGAAASDVTIKQGQAVIVAPYLPALGNRADPPDAICSVAPDGFELPPAVTTGVPDAGRKLNLEAVGLDTDGQIKLIDELSYKPAAGWGQEWHAVFPSITNPAHRELAVRSVFRWYRIVGEPGGQLDALSEHNSYVVGKFWKRGDSAENSAAGDSYPGRFRLIADERVVAFDAPVVQIDPKTHSFQAAELYLVVERRKSCNYRQPRGA